MTGPQIDYAAVYRQLPIPVLLLTPEFAIADVNLASEQAQAARGTNCWVVTFSTPSRVIHQIPPQRP